MQGVGEIIREAESNYLSGDVQMSAYVSSNLKEDVDTIEAYVNSKHTSGEFDSLGREKPFFNICTAAVNIWFRATDIDRKNIRIKAVKQEDYILSLLASIHLQEFMRKLNLGQFLNKWGYTLATYLSAVVKFVEKGGKLIPSVVPWTRLIVDPVDFDNNPKIEKLYFTPAQLKKNKNYDQKKVKELLDALTTRKNADRQNKDTKSGYVEVYEIHGELPLSAITGKEKDEIYEQRMCALSFLPAKTKGEFDDFILYSGIEKDPYMLTSLLPTVDGSISLNGAVKNLFQAQWMANHTAKAIKDQLDLSSKLFFQTSDPAFLGRNALNAIEHGDIEIHAVNQPLTQVNNGSHDIVSLQNQGTMWKQLGNEINGISEAMLGANPPSGSAWRQTQALLNESHSLFEVMTENKGLDIENMMTRFIIPFLKKQMDTTEEISATLQSYQIAQIDSMYVPNEAIRQHNDFVKEEVLSERTENLPIGQEGISADLQKREQDIQKGLNRFGNQRFIKPSNIPTKTWKQVLRNLEWNIQVDITAEQTDIQNIMTTLTTVLQTIASNPMILQDPNMKLIFNRILEMAGGISPIELSQVNTPVVPVAGAVGGTGNLPTKMPEMAMK